jgi:hypothetical protein
METKYKAAFLLHTLGNIFGTKVAKWQTKNSNNVMIIYSVNEFTTKFINLGGINKIDISKWKTTHNPYFHMGIGKSLLNYKNNFDEEFYLNVKNNLILVHNSLIKDANKNNDKGEDIVTQKAIESFTKNEDMRTNFRNKNYRKISCETDPCVRSLCIGMAFFSNENIDKLIECSINITKITHNNVISYLESISIALFASLAIQNVTINLWINKLIELLESDKIKKYIGKDIKDIEDYELYIKQWKKYLKKRFIGDTPINKMIFKNLGSRITYYISFLEGTTVETSRIGFIIMLYDSLLICNGSWESLIFYTMTLFGFPSQMLSICGGLYGLIYDFGDVPQTMISNITDKEEFEKIGRDIYKRFHLSVDTKLEKKIKRVKHK